MHATGHLSVSQTYIRTFIASAIAIAFCGHATASIMSSGTVNIPISTTGPNGEEIDLNGDMQNDFSFGHAGSFAAIAGLPFDPTNQTSFIAGQQLNIGGITENFSSRLPQMTDVNSLFPGQGLPNGTLAEADPNTFAQWVGGQNGYLAVQFQDVNSNVLHGWIQLDFNAGTNDFVIVDYAHTTRPDETIYTGQVPEPACLGLLALAAFGLVVRRRK